MKNMNEAKNQIITKKVFTSIEEGDTVIVRYTDGSFVHYKDGKVHRDNGPARYDQYLQEYYTDGKRNRLDGPAVVCHLPNGNREEAYYIVGKYLIGYDNKCLIAVYCNTNILEPSRIFQLYTRPATKFENKKLGFFVDMCFDNSNYEVFRKALSWYETDHSNSTLFFDEENLEIQRLNLKCDIQKIREILSITPEEFIDNTNVRSLFIRNLTEQDQRNIIYICQGINATLKNLISLRYYKDYLNEILAINKALYGLKNYMKANKKNFLFTQNDVDILFFDLIKILGINDIGEIMTIDLKSDVFIKKDDMLPSKDSPISGGIKHTKYLLDLFREYLSIDIYEQCKLLLNGIKLDNEKNEIILLQVNEIFKENTEEKIKENCKNNVSYFFVYSLLIKLLENEKEDITNDKVLQLFSEEIADAIDDYIKRNAISSQNENNEIFIEKIRLTFREKVIKLQDEDFLQMQSLNKILGSDENKKLATEFSRKIIEEIKIKKYEFQKHIVVN